MTNGLGDGRLRGIGTKGERVERKVGEGKVDFFVFVFCFQPP